MKLSICFICDEYPPVSHGGIGVAVKTLAETLVENNHEVYVIGLLPHSLGGKAYEVINGVEVFRIHTGLKIPFMSRWGLIYRLINKVFNTDYSDVKEKWFQHTKFIEDLVIQKKIDVIEFTDFRFSFSFIKYVQGKNYWPNSEVIKIIKLHGSVNFFRLEAGKKILHNEFKFENSLFQYADQLLSVSPYTKEKVRAYYNLDRQNIKTIYNGIEIRKPINKLPVLDIVVFSGTLLTKKGIIELLKAWNIVCRNNSTVVLEIYGKGLKQRFVHYINKKSIHRVIFKGHIKRDLLLERYQNAKLAIFPSHTETFGLAPIESMMMGCPTIASEIFKKTWFDEKNNPFVMPTFEVFDIDKLSKLIISVLSDRDLRKRLSKNGRDFVKNNFDINKIALEHIKFYTELKKGK